MSLSVGGRQKPGVMAPPVVEFFSRSEVPETAHEVNKPRAESKAKEKSAPDTVVVDLADATWISEGQHLSAGDNATLETSSWCQATSCPASEKGVAKRVCSTTVRVAFVLDLYETRN